MSTTHIHPVAGQGRLVAVLLAAACHGEPDPPPRPQALEPTSTTSDEATDCPPPAACHEDPCCLSDDDDSFTEATPVVLGCPVEGLVGDLDDTDYYVYVSSGPQWIRVETPGSGLGVIDPVVEVFDAAGDLHMSVFDQGAWGIPDGGGGSCDGVFQVFLPRAGTWYLTIADYRTHEGWSDLYAEYYENYGSGVGGCDWDYTIEATEVEPAEPVGGYVPSVVVKPAPECGMAALGVHLEAVGDADYVAISVPFDGGSLSILGHANVPGSAARARVRLYDAAGTLFLDKSDLGVSGQAMYFDLPAGDYVLEASDVVGGGGDDHWFAVYAQAHEEGAWPSPFVGPRITYTDEVEPNDSADQAIPLDPFESISGNDVVLSVTQYIDGRIDTPGDEDWYVIDLWPVRYLDDWIDVRCWSDEYGSLIRPEVALFQDGVDITPPDQGTAPDEWGYFIDGHLAFGTSPVSVRITSQGDASGPGAYYRCTIGKALWP